MKYFTQNFHYEKCTTFCGDLVGNNEYSLTQCVMLQGKIVKRTITCVIHCQQVIGVGTSIREQWKDVCMLIQ